MSTPGSLTPPTFEDALAELERLVAEMEAGEQPLEQALAHYQRGVALLRHCRSTLEAAEQRIQVLENGQLQDMPRTAGEAGS